MNRRAMRKRRLQNRAWALVAALLPATSGWATDGSDTAAMKAGSTSTAAAASTSETGDAAPTGARPKVPPPRRFNPAAFEMQQPVMSRSKTVIPPPRQIEAMPTQTQLLAEPPAGDAQAPQLPKDLETRPDQDSAAAPRPAEIPADVVESSAADNPIDRTSNVAAGLSDASITSGEVSPTSPKANADLSQSTTPQPSTAVEPAAASPTSEAEPMPEAVNQALRALATPAVVGPDSAPASTPVATSEPIPSSTAGSNPAQDRTQSQSEPKAASTPRSDSNAVPVAMPSEAANAGAQAPESKSPSRVQDDQVERTECATCGGYHNSSSGGAFHTQIGCANGSCIPGRQPCSPSNKDCNTVIGAFLENMYQELCCPDPCYEPKWEPAAFASFFADYARPRTVTRIRYDNLENMLRPDRNQFWIDSVPTPKSASGSPPKNPKVIANPQMRLQQVYLYQEAAAGRGSLFVEIPYRQINPNFQPTQAGFGDINFGIKSLLYDRELLQISYQFRTFTPSGNAMNNLGTGNFALDPSIMASLKLGSDTYFQAQFGNWVPLGGKSSLAGGIFYSFMSLNHVLWYPRQDSPLIATLEMDCWSFENGGYTNAIKPGASQIIQKGGGVTYFNIGPGLRQSICNRMDVGGALTFATNSTAHWAEPWFRFEVRFLF